MLLAGVFCFCASSEGGCSGSGRKRGEDRDGQDTVMLIVILGLITGILVGLTGTGGGVLLTPLLMIVTPFPAVVIIGTDIITGACTKVIAVLEHRKLGQVHWGLAKYLIAGSAPGTLAGILLVSFLKAHLAERELDHMLKMTLGLVLFGVSLFLPLVRGKANGLSGKRFEDGIIERRYGAGWKFATIGAVVGFLVAVTSVGSGSLLMVLLLLLVPMQARDLVGTDLLFGLVAMALAGSFHFYMGHFDAGLFLRLAAGALPGVVLGSRLTRLVPERYFSLLFSVLYFSLGARLLVG